MKPLFLQVSSNSPDHQGMVDDHKARHLEYCKRHDYVYIEDPHPIATGWDIMERIKSHMDTGNYSHIFWIDADTFVADLGVDMRDTLGDSQYLALTIHPYPWGNGQPVFHANTGIMYWRCCEKAQAFLNDLLDYRERYGDNQIGINWMLFGSEDSVFWQDGFRVLNCQWNNNVFEQPVCPVVAAFHGYETAWVRRRFMSNISQIYPWS
jgi:hypothetical protein